MNDRQAEERLGEVRLDPSGPVVAGCFGAWTIELTVGSLGIDEGGTIKLAQRYASDWQRPQFDRPTEPGYTTVRTTGEAKLAPRFEWKGHVRPWMKCLTIDVYDGTLAPGDLVTIVLGDRSQGSPGIRAQTFVESRHELRLLVDPTNACVVERLPSSPVFPVVAGEAVELVAIVPTRATVGEPVEVFVKGQDRWGNPTPCPDALHLAWEGDGEVTIEGRRLTFMAPGTGFVLASAGGLEGRSNPVTCHARPPLFGRYWGDLHAQTETTIGTGSDEEYFRFGREVARLDFTSHQGNDFQVTDQSWQKLQEVVRQFHEDGRFVVFPGYEWSGNTSGGGDRNVIYRGEGEPIFRSSHWQVPAVPEDDRSPAHPASVLFERLHRHVGADNAIVAAHVGGRYADVRQFHDADLCRLVEVASCWGVFEWLLWDALDAGQIVGVVCNSDGHKGRPGAEGPGAGEFGIAGGLTCVLAPELTRDAVFDALRERRCYGTTGPRIDLSFEIDGQPMGSVLEVDGDVTASGVGQDDGPRRVTHPSARAGAGGGGPPAGVRRPGIVATNPRALGRSPDSRPRPARHLERCDLRRGNARSNGPGPSPSTPPPTASPSRRTGRSGSGRRLLATPTASTSGWTRPNAAASHSTHRSAAARPTSTSWRRSGPGASAAWTCG